MHYLVNAQKGLTVLWCMILILAYRPENTVFSYVYMGLHGGYGVVWLIKDYFVPDLRFRQVVSLSTALSSLV